MDAKTEKKRVAHLEAVKRYFEAHKNDLRRVSLAWPVPLLERIDEAAAAAEVSRQAWVFRACEEALARLTRRRKRKTE